MPACVQMAPKYQLYRKAITANDTLPVTDIKAGVNFGEYEKAHIQVLPSGGANPTLAVLWWSEAAGRFVAENPALTKAGAGVDTPYEFTIDARGRIGYIAMTTIVAGSVDILVSGFGLNNLV